MDIKNILYEKLLSSFTEECIVPAYIIHQSKLSDDYSIHFQVKEITENLENGIFILPKIELWSGRNDLDRTKLAKKLRLEFIEQLEKEKLKNIRDNDQKNRESVESRKKISDKLISKISWLGSALAATLFISNPIANAVILFIAVTSGKSTLSELIKILKLSFSSWSSGKTNKEKEKELEKEINSKTSAIDEALKNIDIKLHPVMYKAAHENYGVPLTSAKGIVIKADPLPEFIENMTLNNY
jgi:hypothetical protein